MKKDEFNTEFFDDIWEDLKKEKDLNLSLLLKLHKMLRESLIKVEDRIKLDSNFSIKEFGQFDIKTFHEHMAVLYSNIDNKLIETSTKEMKKYNA